MRTDKTDKQEMIEDFRQRKEFCMLTINACKTLLATSDNVPSNVAIAILAGLAEIKRVIEDYYGII